MVCTQENILEAFETFLREVDEYCELEDKEILNWEREEAHMAIIKFAAIRESK